MSNALQILIEQAKEKADECTLALAKTRQQLAQDEEKLTMLENYQQECHNSMLNRSQQGITGMQLQNQLAYSSKIEDALTQQKNHIAFLKKTADHQQQQWQDVLAEQRKYEALIARQAREKEKKEAKRDQKMNDEFAARIYRTRTAGEH